EIAPFEGGEELLRRPAVVAVIGLVAPGQGDAGGVVEVVVPQPVQAVAALLKRANQSALLRLVLGDQEDRAALRRRPGPRASAARTWSAEASKRLCVASRRRPSRWNSSIQ